MNNKIIIALTAFIFLATPAVAQDTQETTIAPVNLTVNDTANSSSIELEALKQVFNDDSERLPSFTSSLIGDQTVLINMSQVDDEGLLEENAIGLKLEGMNITSIQWGEFNETTLEISITQENVEKLMESNDPVHEAGQMLESGELEYKTYTLMNKIKFGLLGLFL